MLKPCSFTDVFVFPARFASLATLVAAFTAFPALAAQPSAAPAEPRQLAFENKPWSGDFDEMLERRRLRVLVPYSRTLYYNDKGHERGITVELVRDFERYLNKKHARKLRKRPLTVYIIPVTRDVLIEDVAKGLGDIAAGNLTETGSRLKVVDFVAPRDRKPVSEVVVTGPASPAIAHVDDLAGKHFHVRKSSSYYTSLISLNNEFRKRRMARIKLTLVPDALEDEDLMEMLNAGLVELIAVDDWKARMWAHVLPKIKVSDIAVAEGGYTGWAIRKGSPKLAEEIKDFYAKIVKTSGVIEYRAAQQHRRIKLISNNTAGGGWKRLEQMLGLFEKYGTKYHFDPLMLAAQGFQESRLRQDARSPVGAIGVMQIMPATGTELKVGDIRILEPNIHAGAKYMDRLMTTYFSDARFNEQNRTLFALASYNAGPGRIVQLRKLAQKRGLDPDQWFNNVELVVAEKVGIETTTYVRNIFKYYTAYRLQLEVLAERRKAREKVRPAPGRN
ncbi:MAG: lytic transglycosylase [Myxococcales bacterium SG8_38_1]|nr:MAG: lytic transglycosylase [Myxococcales bacterium SG8_38_1]